MPSPTIPGRKRDPEKGEHFAMSLSCLSLRLCPWAGSRADDG